MSTTTKNKESKKEIILEHFGVGITDRMNQRMADNLTKKIDLIMTENKEQSKTLFKVLSKALEIESPKNSDFVEVLRNQLIIKYPELKKSLLEITDEEKSLHSTNQ